MALPKYVTVTAPDDGRRTPVHADDGVEPGGGPLYVTSARVRRVAYSHTTLRSIQRGDLILCNMDGDPVDSAELADAKPEFPGDGVEVAAAKLEARRAKAKAAAKKGDK